MIYTIFEHKHIYRHICITVLNTRMYHQSISLCVSIRLGWTILWSRCIFSGIILQGQEYKVTTHQASLNMSRLCSERSQCYTYTRSG